MLLGSFWSLQSQAAGVPSLLVSPDCDSVQLPTVAVPEQLLSSLTDSVCASPVQALTLDALVDGCMNSVDCLTGPVGQGSGNGPLCEVSRAEVRVSGAVVIWRLNRGRSHSQAP
jgi:hypothetical protein